MSRKTKYEDEHGFALIELIVAMGLALIVMRAIFLTFKSQHDSYVIQNRVAVSLQNASASMDMITK